jgi:hypothetical protein
MEISIYMLTEVLLRKVFVAKADESWRYDTIIAQLV